MTKGVPVALRNRNPPSSRLNQRKPIMDRFNTFGWVALALGVCSLALAFWQPIPAGVFGLAAGGFGLAAGHQQ